MASKPTIRDVARLAGVSIGTASNVINNSDTVAAGLRANVERAVAELGFQPSAAAQSIRGGRTKSVGILVSDITVERLAILVRSAQRELEAAGFAVFVLCHENKREREAEHLALLMRRRADGVIRSYCTDRTVHQAAQKDTSPIPIVSYDRDGPASGDLVQVAYGTGVSQAMAVLAGMGHRRIGLITGPAFMYPARVRFESYREALAVAGLPFSPDLVRHRSFENAGLDTVGLLSEPDPPTALVLGGTSMLSGALTAIRARGLAIPDDLSLVASHDSDVARLVTPPIAAIRWDMEEAGRLCANLLLERIASPTLPQRRVLIEPTFVVRASCAPPRRSGPSRSAG